MSSMIRKLVFALCLLGFVASCGVRGKPQPPLTPAELGRGQPTFRRATEGMAVKSVPGVSSTPEQRKSKSADGSVE